MDGAPARSIRFSELERWDVKYFIARIKSMYPLVSLAQFITEHNEKVRPFERPEDTFKILGVNNVDGIFHAYDSLGKEIKQPYKKVSAGDFAYNPYRINIGSLGWVPPKHDGAYISPAYVVFFVDKSTILPEIFWFILKSDFFNQTLRAATAGSVRMNLTYPLLRTLKIPIPPKSVQRNIVEHWEAMQTTISRVNNRVAQIEKEIQAGFFADLGLKAPKRNTPPKTFLVDWQSFERWSVRYNQAAMSMIDLSHGKYPVVELGSILELVQYGTSEKANNTENGTPVFRIKNIKEGYIDISEIKHIPLAQKTVENLRLLDGDILIIRTSGSRDLVGTCAVFHEKGEYAFASYLIRLRPSPKKALSDFIAWYINSSIGRQQVDSLSRQIMQNNINSQELRNIRIPLPPLDVQSTIIERLKLGRKEILHLKDNVNRMLHNTQIEIEQMILGTRQVEDI